jgi:hypothetical protein
MSEAIFEFLDRVLPFVPSRSPFTQDCTGKTEDNQLATAAEIILASFNRQQSQWEGFAKEAEAAQPLS